MEGKMWLALTSIVLATVIGIEVVAVAVRHSEKSHPANED
jgi:hypothetical protein